MKGCFDVPGRLTPRARRIRFRHTHSAAAIGTAADGAYVIRTCHGAVARTVAREPRRIRQHHVHIRAESSKSHIAVGASTRKSGELDWTASAESARARTEPRRVGNR